MRLKLGNNSTESEVFDDVTLPIIGNDVGQYYIRGCLQGAVQKGFNPEDLLEVAEIDRSAYSNPEARINGEQLQRLLLTIRNTLNDEYFGFLENPGKPEMSYMVARAAVRSETFGQAIQKMARLVNAVRNDIELRVDVDDDDDYATFSSHMSGLVDGANRHFLSFFKMYWLYKFQCWLIGQRIKLNHVYFFSSKPEETIDYSQAFDCPVTFDHPRTAWRFQRKYLSAPIIRNEVEIQERDFAYGYSDWFAIPGKYQTFTSRVEQLITDLYRKGMRAPNLDIAGDILCCSPRTLSRRLQREGFSFQELKVKVRRDLAQKLLLSTDMSVAEIADKVGFAEPGDFARAYVAWTGSTPSNYRIQQGKRDASNNPK